MVNLAVAKYERAVGSNEGGGGGKKRKAEINDVPMWKTIKDFSLPDISVNVEGKGQDLEGRVNSKGECGNGGLRINAPGDAVLRHDAKNDLVEMSLELDK
ncbi:hypothetical protein JHK85_053908 [Glycine max]|nr:hypothetical protein JHK85_053908 [Glycine max]